MTCLKGKKPLIDWHFGGLRLPRKEYSFRQKWCPEYEAGLVEHTAAELFDAGTQDRCTTYVAMRVRIDRRAKRSQRCLSIAKARATVTVK